MPQFEMPDIPMKPELELKRLREEVAFLQKEITQQKRASSPKPARKRKSTRTTTSVKQTAMTVKRPVKKLPPLGAKQTEQPRDRLGRFARKAGTFIVGTVASSAKTIRKAHRTVSRVRAAGRRRANLEARERKLALAAREKKLGIRKKRVRRRKR